MKTKIIKLIILLSFSKLALASKCDCLVMAYAPLTASHKMPPNVVKKFQLESYDKDTIESQIQCRKSCFEVFGKQMNQNILSSLLMAHTEDLIDKKWLGFNCTGLTTVKYPVRVKAKLGSISLGNVADLIHVVNHERICF